MKEEKLHRMELRSKSSFHILGNKIVDRNSEASEIGLITNGIVIFFVCIVLNMTAIKKDRQMCFFFIKSIKSSN